MDGWLDSTAPLPAKQRVTRHARPERTPSEARFQAAHGGGVRLKQGDLGAIALETKQDGLVFAALSQRKPGPCSLPSRVLPAQD